MFISVQGSGYLEPILVVQGAKQEPPEWGALSLQGALTSTPTLTQTATPTKVNTKPDTPTKEPDTYLWEGRGKQSTQKITTQTRENSTQTVAPVGNLFFLTFHQYFNESMLNEMMLFENLLCSKAMWEEEISSSKEREA